MIQYNNILLKVTTRKRYSDIFYKTNRCFSDKSLKNSPTKDTKNTANKESINNIVRYAPSGPRDNNTANKESINNIVRYVPSGPRDNNTANKESKNSSYASSKNNLKPSKDLDEKSKKINPQKDEVNKAHKLENKSLQVTEKVTNRKIPTGPRDNNTANKESRNNIALSNEMEKKTIERFDDLTFREKTAKKTNLNLLGDHRDFLPAYKEFMKNLEANKNSLESLPDLNKKSQKTIPKIAKKTVPNLLCDPRDSSPANKESRNSSYALNNNSLKSLPVLEKMTNRTIQKKKDLTGLLRGKAPKITKKIIPKIVGDNRHYSPANKEWKNSIYAYNKNSLKSLPVLDKMANKTIKSYFSLSNNKKLARSKRMRTLIRRSTVKRLFVSRPEIKQTSDKVNITVYTFNREKQFFLRKMYFYKRNMYLDKDIYFFKLWLNKNLLAFKKTFNHAESVKLDGLIFNRNKKIRLLRTKRRKINKTYIHNILLKKYVTKGEGGFALSSASKKIEKSLQGKFSFLYKLNPLVKRNIFKSLKKRNLLRFLKKQEMKTGFRRINLTDEVRYKRLRFKNYFSKKVSRKIKFKLRNKHNIFKIRQKVNKLKKSRFGKIRLPYSNLKLKNEIKFFSFRLVSELKYIRKLFFFYFIKYILFLFQIKIKISQANLPKKRAKQDNDNKLSRLLYEFTGIKKIKNRDSASFSKKTSKRQGTLPSKKGLKNIKFIKRYSYDKLKNIELLNLELLNFLRLTLAEGGIKNLPNKEKIDSLYKIFEKNYFLTFLSKFFKKEFLYINYYSKFLINQLKFGKFLPGLKLLISKIYSKKVELNLVNLKYSHLNSDIYTDSIATKLKRKIGLLRVLKWSLKLARLPYNYIANNNAAFLNKFQTLSIHKSLDVNRGLLTLTEGKNKFLETLSSSEDRLNVILNKLYPHSLAHTFKKNTRRSPLKRFIKAKEQNNTATNRIPFLRKSALDFGGTPLDLALAPKNISVLNTIRYKWVSGVRLEAAGRLTRRYTAARSVFKFRYKGSLKNIDYSLKTDITKKNISTVMLRNYVKPNSQYTFTKSKRRIGAFGLKAWISSY